MTPKVIAKPYGHQDEHGSETQTKKERLDARIKCAPPADCLHRRRGGRAHARIAFDEVPIGIRKQNVQLVANILTNAVCKSGYSVETSLVIGTVQRAQRQTGGNLLFSHSDRFPRCSARATASRWIRLEIFTMSFTASSRTDASGLDSLKPAIVVSRTRLK